MLRELSSWRRCWKVCVLFARHGRSRHGEEDVGKVEDEIAQVGMMMVVWVGWNSTGGDDDGVGEME